MKNHKILFGFIAAFAFISLFSCSKSEKIKVKVDYEIYAPSVDYSPETKPDTLIVSFSGSVSPLDMVQKKIETPIEIRPAIEGSWSWRNDSELVFSPVERWKLGESYKVHLPPEIFSENVIVKGNNKTNF